MRWAYKTVHYGLKKDGLLGGAFLDDEELEESLNDYGKSGWELLSLLEVRDGVIAVFKQPLEVAGRELMGRSSEKKVQPAMEQEIQKDLPDPLEEKPVVKRSLMMDDVPRPDYIIESDPSPESEKGRDAGAIRIE